MRVMRICAIRAIKFATSYYLCLNESFLHVFVTILCNMADVFREEETWLETLATQRESGCKIRTLHLSLLRLAIEPEALHTRILRQWIERHSAVREVTLFHLDHLRTLAAGRCTRAAVDLPGACLFGVKVCIFCLKKNRLYLLVFQRCFHIVVYCSHLGRSLIIPQGGWRVRAVCSI